MSAGEPAPPAQTITMSSDALGRELAGRLEKSLSGFRVYRSSYYVRLRCEQCTEVLRTVPQAELLTLVNAAMQHECPFPGRPG